MIRRLIFAALLASVVIPTFPQLLKNLRLARDLRPLSMPARREKLMPDTYAAIEAIRAAVPMNEPIALIGVSRESLDEALFVNYYLYPHPTKIFGDRWAYVSAGEKPKVMVRLGPTLRQTTYAELRNEELRRWRVVRDIRLPSEARTDFAIPIVTSTDGPPPVSYTIEGAIACDREAHVTLTLEPDHIVNILTIRETRTFYDLVYECFGVMKFASWVHVSSDAPVRSAFWLVNRTARTAAPLHLAEGPLTRPAPFPVDPAAGLWLLNLGNDPALVHVGAANAGVPPRTLIGTHADGTVTGRVYAFVTKKKPNGDTQFIWPEDLK